MDRADILRRYRELGAAIDRGTTRIRARHPCEVHCAAGCNHCCHDFFQVSILEATAVRTAVLALPAATRRRVAANLRRLQAELSARGLDQPEGHHAALDHAATGRAFRARRELEGSAAAPCPLNVDGACSVYEDRPVICRTFGFLVDGFFFGCPGGNFEDEEARYASLAGGAIDRELRTLSSAFVAGTPLEERETDNRFMAAVDWNRWLGPETRNGS